MVFNATFNNISVISWRSVLLMEETGVSRKNHRPVASLHTTGSSQHYQFKRKTTSKWDEQKKILYIKNNLPHLHLQ